VQRPVRRSHLGTREPWQHALGTALIAASLRLDADTRLAALCFAVGDVLAIRPTRSRSVRRGVAELVEGLRRLNGLRVITRMTTTASAPRSAPRARCCARCCWRWSRTSAWCCCGWPRAPRRCATSPTTRATRESIARESLDIYAPLANRLGIWQLKWELEDLSFRFLEPDTYKRIARMLDERRVEREQFIVDAVARLKAEVAAIGVKAEVYGRPKHIYSIYNKMRAKRLDFSQIFDVRRCACWWTR
jgi:GTP pyrophosphokinase